MFLCSSGFPGFSVIERDTRWQELGSRHGNDRIRATTRDDDFGLWLWQIVWTTDAQEALERATGLVSMDDND